MTATRHNPRECWCGINHAPKQRITEATYERIVDRAVQNRLERSNAYRWAENADEQAAVEESITAQVEAEYDELYEVAS